MTRSLQLPDLRRILDGLERRLGILERRIRPQVEAAGDTNHEGAGSESIVLGARAATAGEMAIGIGADVDASGQAAVVVGEGSEGTAQNATAVGPNTDAAATDAAAFGYNSFASGVSSVALGTNAGAAGDSSVAVGSASASGTGATVIGSSAEADEDYGTVVGFNAHADNTDGTALGHNARAFHIHATAIGPDAETTDVNQVMLGTATDHVVIPGTLVLGGSTSGLTDGDIPATIARDSEVAAAVTAHEAAGDPHTGYATDTDLTTHAATPHGGAHPDLATHNTLGLATQAELDAHDIDTTSVHGIADTSVLATDAEVATAVSDHAALADPHTGYQKESEKDQNSGYAGLAAAQGTRDGTKFLRDDGTWAAAGGAHPDLAAHDTLGLATQAELDTHAAAADPHTGYLKESVVSGMAAPTIALGATAAAGVATTVISSDATIDAFDTTAPNVIEPDDAAAVGVINFAARRDHEHGIVTAVAGASTFADAAAEGSATSFARSDHRHSREANPVTAHEAAGNPHPGYATDGDLTTHAGAGDPHPGYVLESLIDAAADLIVGTAADTVGRLAKGAALDVLRVNAGATALEWAAPAAGVDIEPMVWMGGGV